MNVFIKSLSDSNSPKTITSEGLKKFNSSREIEVSLELALQLVDDKNWSCKEDLKKLAKKFGLDEESKPKEEISDEDDESQNESEEENLADDEDIKEEEEDEEESPDMGDDEIRSLIKKIPHMLFKDLKEAAVQAGIDVEGFAKSDKKKLARLLIKTLKGK